MPVTRTMSRHPDLLSLSPLEVSFEKSHRLRRSLPVGYKGRDEASVTRPEDFDAAGRV